ncbi:T9SS type A sorting domain-containing protein [Hymenobacter endophyticus]|uniref:T9SS type A sorting domain-containing protein n=1 Tax=Hymenobacter endophyticus TaxID=3076335 RepID=A0ABU3TKU2_9BACT|nr:T9SS type A sorting domain-containing protein [Hymenobacter endophyticus]MDU0371989.1 T9SS type A sorting domain-containing protein [Hymenobacter endophyticus]
MTSSPTAPARLSRRLWASAAALVAAAHLSASPAQAQVLPPATPFTAEKPSLYTQLIDSLIAPLSKANIPGGILYDRVPSVARLHDFTATTPSNGSHFLQSYFELRTAAYEKFAFPYERSVLRTAVDQIVATGYVPIGLLDYRFAVLDTLAEERGTIREANGLYYDGNGSPYQQRDVTVGSVLADTVASQFQLSMPAGLLLGNRGRSVRFVFVRGYNQAFTLQPGSSAQMTFFGTSGWQNLTLTYYLTDGSTAQATCQLYVRPPLASRPNGSVFMPFGAPVRGRAWTDYDGLSAQGEGEAAGYLYHPQSQRDARLRNPVIVMDGFDPSDKRKLPQIAQDFAPLEPALSVPGRERDLVILNFPWTLRPDKKGVWYWADGGADYIERNALVFVELLNRVKQLMIDPTQKITVIGPSMGGLISRYALALMEKNFADASNPATYQNPYWQHNVDTWLSFDAPHGGANIPLGDQAFLRYFEGVSEQAEINNKRLQSVAAKQMLVQHISDLAGLQYHVPFMRNLNNNGLPGSFGYPTQVRRVGLANGASSGLMNTQLGSPGATGLQLDVVRNAGNKRRQFFYRSTEPGTQIAANMYFGPGAGGMATVFNGEARVIVALAKDIKKRVEMRMTSPHGTYDLAPGSTFDTQYQIQYYTLTGKQIPGYSYRFSRLAPNHCFIPTVSALAFQYRNLSNYGTIGNLPNPYTDLSSRGLICQDETPFHEYYTYGRANAPHVTLDAAAQQFVTRALFNVTQPPRFAPGNPVSVCPGATISLRLDDCTLPSPRTVYAWSISGPAVFTGSGTTSVADGGQGQSIRHTGGAGTIIVSVIAQRPGAAPAPAATHTITSAAGSDPLTISVDMQGQYRICPYSSVTLQALGRTPGPYTWTRRTIRPTGPTAPLTTTTTSPTLPLLVRYDPIEVTVTAPDPCGGQPLPLGDLTVTPDYDPNTGSHCDPYTYELTPNPSESYLLASTLVAGEPLPTGNEPEAESPHAFRAELYNDRGRKVRTQQTRVGQARLDVRDLPAGLYVIRLTRGRQVISRNIRIQH